MSRVITLGALAGTFLAGLGACTTPPSSTDLNTAGPPMVRQVLMTEEFTDTQNVRRTRPLALAYGKHDDVAFVDDDRKVVTAVADPTGQVIRVVIDELLIGNNLEMIQCRAPVDLTLPVGAQNYSRVPLGADPDDVARCSGSQDLVLALCTGDKVVCINNTGGPVTTDDKGILVQPGQPVGIEDIDPFPDGDGVPDHDRFIEGSVRVMCKGVGGKTVEAPLNLSKSYWQPSGNQQVPAHGGVAELGPALVLFLDKGLPTNTQCSVVFDSAVTDKDGNTVCAPPDGDIDQNCPGDGDTSLVSFGVAALRLEQALPQDGSTSVARTKKITVQFNTSMSTAALASSVTITENGVGVLFTVVQEKDSNQNPLLKYDLLVRGGNQLAAAATYVVTINPTVADFADQPLGGNPITYTFTTAP